jgi:surface carbohydrate biosynthesis protein (TIGR04326 family)
LAADDLGFLWRGQTLTQAAGHWQLVADLVRLRSNELVSEHVALLSRAYEEFARARPKVTSSDLDAVAWWQTLPSVYSLDAGSDIFTLFCLTAVADEIHARQANRVTLVNLPVNIAVLLRAWLTSQGYAQEQPVSGTLPCKPLPRTGSIAHPWWRTRAAGRLIRQWGSYRRSSFDSRRRWGRAMHCPALVVDYGGQIDATASSQGHYVSKYWGAVAQLIESRAPDVVWLHIDVRTAATPSATVAMRGVKALDALSGAPRHEIAQTHLTLLGCIQAYRRMLKQARWLRAMWSTGSLWQLGSAKFDSRMAITDSMRDITTGGLALQRCIWDEVMRHAVAIHRPRRIIYLLENQSWEHSLLRAAHADSIPAIAVAHSMVVPIDTRMACLAAEGSAPSTLMVGGTLRIAVNGPLARQNLLDFGLRSSALAEVEAARFQWDPDPRSVHSVETVLVLGTYDRGQTQYLLDLLRSALALVDREVDVVVRNHPALWPPIALDEHWARVDASASIQDALRACTWVVCSNSSSSVVDAVLAGLPVLLVPDPDTLDPRWERCLSTAQRITTARALAEALSVTRAPRLEVESGAGIIFLDSSLSRWRALLESFLDT